MQIWVNGRLQDAEEATVSVLDHGMTVGDGVFETVKTTDGRPFALRRHIDRLERSARGLGLPAPDRAEVERACAAVLEANPTELGRLRITYTGGLAPLGSERGEAASTLVVALGPTVRRTGATAVVTVPWRRNEHGATAGLKTTSYAENVVALARAHQHDAGEALLANTAGRLCEGTASNVFVVVGGRLLTPPLSSGCLAGITRALVLEWTDAEEADLPYEVLQEAEEVFLTGTLRDVQGVSRVDERELPGAPGPVTAKVSEIFAARAAADLEP
ncbi:aminotransferase class IV [Streptacidiphilus fuscans]|uniref:aminodeoxychorismate lyase n=1 Tax=Streptacidiphilus fuscans TaxID=2789292 RepID=A0A931FBG1_9ACTN|nr:aminodeoxychorismate lyase [Streptacidiphilus fuscans]MBF9068627.1 aminodeoxychorismate lyase [Streptacidiphilus fuscans]